MRLVMRSVASVCLSVCPVRALTFESFNLEISFWNVIASSEYLGQVRIQRSSSQGQGHSSKKLDMRV